VHRIGRTGRAGNTGEALSLVSSDEDKLLYGIERLIKKAIPKVSIAGFEPDPEDIKVAQKEAQEQKQRRSSHQRRRSPNSNRKPAQGQARSSGNRSRSR